MGRNAQSIESPDWETPSDEGVVQPAPVHPAAQYGHHAVKLFEEVVEHTTVRRRATKTSEKLVDAGVLYDRHKGQDEYGFDVFEFSARIEAYEEYCDWLDAQDAAQAVARSR